jgi:hypothetical protein
MVMVLVVVMRMRMGYSVVRVFVRMFLTVTMSRLVPMRVLMMAVIVRVFVCMCRSFVGVGVRMLCHTYLLRHAKSLIAVL